MALGDLKTILKKAKFSEKEIEVYVSLLKLGSSIASDIAKQAKINRSTTYVILGALLERDLIKVNERRGAKMYVANPPENLVKYFESAEKEFGEFARVIKKMLPELKKQYASVATKPKVRFYEGSEGVKTVYEDALSSLEMIRTYALNKEEGKVMDEDAQKYFDDLARKNIRVRVLMPENSEKTELAGRKGKVSIPQDFSPEISIYDNKISFASPAEEFALIIESPELARALKKAFDLSWKETKDAKKKPLLGGALAG